MSREAQDDPEFLVGVPERAVGSLPGIEKPGGSNSGSSTWRTRKAKPMSYGIKYSQGCEVRSILSFEVS